jgi:hypothetical protein
VGSQKAEVTARQAVPQVWCLVAGFSQRRPGVNPRVIRFGFVVDKENCGKCFSGHFGSSLPVIIPPALHARLSSGSALMDTPEAGVPRASAPSHAYNLKRLEQNKENIF